ncbi:MAG: hypothetical protein JSR80_05100, partial [Verrucomicrobia bacterium]|nr:hypothetical protein [Verrucomicrobiota bacterium]
MGQNTIVNPRYLGIFFIAVATCAPLFASVVPDESTLVLRTPTLADVEVLKLRLDNGLEALLISDPGASEAGAALSVEVGTWQDPKN